MVDVSWFMVAIYSTVQVLKVMVVMWVTVEI